MQTGVCVLSPASLYLQHRKSYNTLVMVVVTQLGRKATTSATRQEQEQKTTYVLAEVRQQKEAKFEARLED